LPFIIVGLGMLAQRFRPLAWSLDWLEVKLRKMKKQGTAWWRQASILAKGAAALLLAVAVASVGYGAFRVVFGD
jgi:hypothetical protein